ncbi:MAG: hypothetical protein FD153_1004 [Rhodospirillaceae bacterium]|nr:MAG: hypothetical protein FD153_1004 [Rhodospirillaceae bacterium]
MLVTRCRTIALVAAVAMGSAAVAGCHGMQDNPKTAAGTVLGGIGGGALGAQFGKGTSKTAAIIAGALLGGLVGSEIGQSLDRADRQYMESARQRAYSASLNEPITWNNPQSGHQGSFTAVREGAHQRTGEYCREFNSTLVVEGRQQTATGTACHQADGTWRVIGTP